MGAGIELERVSYTYPGSKTPAIINVSTRLESSACIGVTGPNGSGKTTLLKIISLLYKPVAGRVLYNGVDPWRSDVTMYRRRIVHVHDKPVMVRGSVYDNIALGLKIRGYSDGVVAEKIREIAGKLGLLPLLDSDARSLSAGQRQLVSIARALVLDPDVLVLDEPYSNLDFKRRKSISSIIRGLVEGGKLVVMASHDIGVLGSLCDRIVYLEDGSIVMEGPAGEMYRKLLGY